MPVILPPGPVELSIEQIGELNNNISLIVAAVELMHMKPQMTESLMETFSAQPMKISDRIARFSAELEKMLTRAALSTCRRQKSNFLSVQFLYVTTDDPAGWSPGPHNLFGNLLLSDGNVQQDSTARLRQAIANKGFPTNRLLMP